VVMTRQVITDSGGCTLEIGLWGCQGRWPGGRYMRLGVLVRNGGRRQHSETAGAMLEP
jgi:hypothetical protein